jgi:hypothetical protein
MKAASHADKFVKALQEAYKCQCKGVGTLAYHLGCAYYRDKHGTVLWSKKVHLNDGY